MTDPGPDQPTRTSSASDPEVQPVVKDTAFDPYDSRAVGVPIAGDVLQVSGSPEARIAHIAKLQYGRISRLQMRQAGLSQRMITTRVARGSLIRITQGVYAPGHIAGSFMSDAISGLLAAPIGSPAEERFLELVRDAELPRPIQNAPLHGFVVDFYWPEAAVVVEVDGYQWHSTRSAFERDRRKDDVLKFAGIEVTRVTWEAMERRSPSVIARLAARLALRTHAQGAGRARI